MNMCSKCGEETQPGVNFCKACGTRSGAHQRDGIQEKKSRVMAEEKQGLTTVAIVGGVIVAALAAAFLFFIFRGKTDTAVRMSIAYATNAATKAPMIINQVNGEVRIPLPGLGETAAKYYTYRVGNKEVLFFALRKNSGQIGLALDACSACYRAKRGYRQEAGQIVCNNCGMAFRAEDIGTVTGGCNPIPLKHAIAGEMAIVKAAELEKNATYF